MSNNAASSDAERNRAYWSGIARGVGGALLFSLPILMTMETWWLGFYMGRWRLALYVALSVPLVLGLSYLSGLREDVGWRETTLDGITAYGVGILTSVGVLSSLGLLTLDMSMRELIGKTAVQSPTAALGAVLARSLLGAGASSSDEEDRKQRSGYWGELFLVMAGAFYLASTVASTREMILIPFKMDPWHGAVVLLLSLVLMHAFLYTMKFAGAPNVREGTPWWSIFLRYTVPGYVIVLIVCAYILWTFGRFESYTPHWVAMYTIALGFPGAVGGAAGRLIV